MVLLMMSGGEITYLIFAMGFFLLLGYLFYYSLEHMDDKKDKIQQLANMNQEYLQQSGFICDAEYGYESQSDNISLKVFVDNHNDKMIIFDGLHGNRWKLNFEEILGMELKVDNVSSNGIGRAVVGGLLFGGAGAVVGAMTGSKKVMDVKAIIYINDVAKPFVEVTLNHDYVMRCDSYRYKKMMEFENRLEATIRAIISKNESNVV